MIIEILNLIASGLILHKMYSAMPPATIVRPILPLKKKDPKIVDEIRAEKTLKRESQWPT